MSIATAVLQILDPCTLHQQSLLVLQESQVEAEEARNLSNKAGSPKFALDGVISEILRCHQKLPADSATFVSMMSGRLGNWTLRSCKAQIWYIGAINRDVHEVGK